VVAFAGIATGLAVLFVGSLEVTRTVDTVSAALESAGVVMQGLTSAADSIIDDAALLARDAQDLSELPECIDNGPCAALAPTLTALSGDFSGGPAGAAVASIATLLAKPAETREKQTWGFRGLT
jgi:hypothetical protein